MEADAYTGDIWILSPSRFLQINSRIQVVTPTHEGAKILFCERATVSRPIIFIRFLHSRRAKRHGAMLRDRRFSNTDIVIDIDAIYADHERIQEAAVRFYLTFSSTCPLIGY